ncbi:hypothetical protein PR048_014132 [Dryococelus australis]|uniref:PiggyBac transposable element-derived protein domain-containing protein n=1 Tax=Dryococelus australis TaxID=614101 RepID=A0ABQ9HDA7_9NEOP|nr:hypothetical protein PR048_014132 [Dryococelus australis]
MTGDVEDVTFHSNLYATQNEKIFNLKEGESLCFLGINFMMGYHKLQSWKHCWSTPEDLGVPVITNAMPRDRFETILRYLHANDNTSVPHGNKDKIYKLWPVVNKLNDRLQQVYKWTRELSIDDSIILFKGRSTLKQYNHTNPIKRGYKLVYNLAFKVYQGNYELAETEFQDYSLGERVILELSKHAWGSVRELYLYNIYFLRSRFLRDWQQKKTHS